MTKLTDLLEQRPTETASGLAELLDARCHCGARATNFYRQGPDEFRGVCAGHAAGKPDVILTAAFEAHLRRMMPKVH